MTSLSNSELWTHMEDYYEQMGVEVWEDEVVPLDITSNVYLANLYSRLIIGAISDYHAEHGQSTAEPFTIIELGVGHGKFSFYLLKKLLQALSIYQLPANTIRYIMTDISDKNIEAWRANKAFAPFIKQGILDFALYNALDDSEMKLKLSQDVLTSQSLSKPVFVVANYLFDTLPHDAFQIVDSSLKEAQLNINRNGHASSEILIKDIFENANFDFTYNQVTSQYYQAQPELNKVLDNYVSTFEEASFTIPIGGVRCIDQLQKLTKDALILLVADKAIANIDLFEGLEPPDITTHGSVSMTVNFEALAQYTELRQGQALLMDNQNADFQVAALIFNHPSPMPHISFAFKSSLSAFSPVDLYSLCYSAEKDTINTTFESLDELLAMLNLAEWDPNIFYDYHESILENLEKEEASLEQEAGLINGIERVWEYFFQLESNRDIPFSIGCIFYELEVFDKAIFFYEQSLELFGRQHETYHNLALAYVNAEQPKEALAMAREALTIEPSYQEAKDLINELEAS